MTALIGAIYNTEQEHHRKEIRFSEVPGFKFSLLLVDAEASVDQAHTDTYVRVLLVLLPYLAFLVFWPC